MYCNSFEVKLLENNNAAACFGAGIGAGLNPVFTFLTGKSYHPVRPETEHQLGSYLLLLALPKQ